MMEKQKALSRTELSGSWQYYLQEPGEVLSLIFTPIHQLLFAENFSQ